MLYFSLQTIRFDISEVVEKLADTVYSMQELFSSVELPYFQNILFHISPAIHRVMPTFVHRSIMIDVDLKFLGDIRLLYDQFRHFNDTHLIGIANEQQPTYRHLFKEYRHQNPRTIIGDPPPNGLPGFNSGVILLDLEKMRNSHLYNTLLEKEKIEELAKHFMLSGYLGDQDFYTLVNLVHREMFYQLPCEFNRQLSTWWLNHGYEDVADLYINCTNDVIIYHGNGKSLIPE